MSDNGDSKKNLLLLAMSTLPKTVKENKFNWENSGCKDMPYHSQLEPISRMIIKKYGSLDEIIILATKATLEKVAEETKEVKGKTKEKINCCPIAYYLKKIWRKKEYTKINYSPVEYYLEKIGRKIEDKTIKIINIDEDNYIPAVDETIQEVREYYNEQNGNVNFFIDTQGGFRNISMVLNAVISLLRNDNISPKAVYSVSFNIANGNVNMIKDQTDSYKIFQFVSGMNEYAFSGSAKQLNQYFDDIAQNNSTPKNKPNIVKDMDIISSAIQMCDISTFDEGIKQLKRHKEEIGNNVANEDTNQMLLNIFTEQIYDDYGDLLKDTVSGFDKIEWFLKKGLLQQALTYIEAKMPQELMRKDILSYELGVNEKDLDKNPYDPVENYVLMKFMNNKAIFKRNNIESEVPLLDDSGNFKEIDKNLDVNKPLEFNYRLKPNVKSKSGGEDKTEGKENQENQENSKKGNIIIAEGKKTEILELILLYKLLKNERNSFNHMKDTASGKEMEDANYIKQFQKRKTDITNVVEKFIKLGKEIYGNKKNVFVNCSNHPSSEWPQSQIDEAEKYGTIVDIPFPRISCDISICDMEKLVEEMVDKIMEQKPNAVMCMGEFVVTFRMVKKLQEKGVTVLAAITNREVKETCMENGKVTKESIFEFKGFRKY